ncbi:MAG: AmpG family muropeptide MFS transporter [FCB group bacterium]|nr:AmpG family muropeptide MFS transporter [FCB group bacterium]
MTAKTSRNPWYWVPSLYFAEGIPYVIVMLLSVVFYKRMGISNADIALYTSWLYLPWVIKPLWSPIVDILRTKRFWIVTTQLFIGAGLGGLVLAIPVSGYFKLTLGFFWLLAFSSATHDIAADGFYMLGLSQKKQAWFVGIRSTFYRLAMITGQGLLIILAGYLESTTGLPSVGLSVTTQSARETVVEMPAEIPAVDPDKELHLILDPPELAIPMIPRTPAYVDSIRTLVKTRNGEQVKYGKQTTPPSENIQPGLWHRFVSQPIEKGLRAWLGTAAPVNVNRAQGNVGIVHIRLSAPPPEGEKVVVNFGRISGDKSITLLAGGRSEFTAKNWNQPVLALIQIDPKLKTSVTTQFEARAGNIPLAWMITFGILAVLFVLFFLYHRFILPYPDDDRGNSSITGREFLRNFGAVFAEYFTKERILVSIAFILFYRFGEAQLVKIAPLFMLDVQEAGGMALTTGQYGFVYGTVGLLMLTLGGIVGGILSAKQGLKYWVWWMAIAMNLPNAVYVYLSSALPDNFFIINACVGIEQFGYGFGFTAYMLYMISVAEGKHKTAHYALCTGFMALGMMIPGMFSGWLQEIIGYQNFFIWVLLATIPGFILIRYIPIDPEFGKKED